MAGGLLAGLLADLLDYRAAIGFVVTLTAIWGLIARVYLPARRRLVEATAAPASTRGG